MEKLLEEIKKLESSLVDALLAQETLDVDLLNEIAREAHFLQNIILKVNQLQPGAKNPYSREVI